MPKPPPPPLLLDNRTSLPDAIYYSAVMIDFHHSVWNCDVVKVCSLLIWKKYIRDPHLDNDGKYEN